MLMERIQVYRENQRYIRYEKREIQKLSRIDCDAHCLRAITAGEIHHIFTDPAVDHDWAESEKMLSRHCAIADGATSAVNPGDRRALYYLIRGLMPGRVLEIGTHVGASTAHIASALSALSHRNELQKPALVSVDLEDVNAPNGPWKRMSLQSSPSDMLQGLGIRDMVLFIQNRSPEFLRQPLHKYDLIFLDGSHAASVVYQEIPLALSALNQNGVILLHDFYPGNRPLWSSNRRIVPGPWIAVQRLRKEGAPLQAHPLGALPWPTKMGTSVTSLALLAREL
jgi:predicted O-methyltransferase YrrM